MRKIKLLLADDSMLMRDIFSSCILESFPDIKIVEAGNGREAQKLLEVEEFDAVLCDWEMPELSGLELLKWLRSDPKFEKLPFVMITGTNDKKSVVECISAGVTDYMVKPVMPEALCQKISRLLKIPSC